MSDDRIVTLLAEIRDLQREHLARTEEAIRRQDEAIADQREAMEQVRRTTRRVFRLVVPAVALAFVVCLLLLLS